MKKEAIQDFLQGIELFEDLEANEIALLSDVASVEKNNAGSYLFKENGERDRIFIIREGEVELLKKAPSGENKRLSFFKQNDFLGEGTLIDNTPHTTSAKTITSVSLLVFEQSDLNELFETEATLGMRVTKKLAKVISRRMSISNLRLISAGTQYISGGTRTEHDLLGDREVWDDVYYGIQTLRALENFNISGVNLSFYPSFIQGLAMVKQAAARANKELGLLDDRVANAIDEACSEVINGKYNRHFVVDMIQGGAGTSTNMNANEVIANRALEIMGYKKGDYTHCHPNNHVNLSQSTNDAYPTAVKIAFLKRNKQLVKVLMDLISSFKVKADEFAHVIKMGRTQLQDAVPMTLGQAFGAYSSTLDEEVERLTQNVNLFLEVNMGATAIGTGINSEPRYSQKVIGHLRDVTGMDIVLARNLIEATQDTSAFIMYSSALKRLGIKLSKISNDLRLLSSGPRTGFNEINLPAMQPGSSIMPGKVNPVIPEVVNQIAFKVIGNDITVSMASEAGQLELNVMEPIIVQSIFESIEMLENGMNTLMNRCVEGITANEAHCKNQVMNSIGIITALNPVLGYENSTAIAKEALETNRSVYELVIEKKLLSEEEVTQLLAPENMLKPRKFYKK